MYELNLEVTSFEFRVRCECVPDNTFVYALRNYVYVRDLKERPIKSTRVDLITQQLIINDQQIIGDWNLSPPGLAID